MTCFTDEEWQALLERTALDVEVRVLAADCAVKEAEADAATWDAYVRQFPNTKAADVERRLRRHLAALPFEGFTPQLATRHVEEAVYGWRRDYGEWPSPLNTADRLANECGITHDEAMEHIIAALNDPSDRAHVYLIRTARIDEIVDDVPNASGPAWASNGETEVSLYVSAEGQSAHRLADAYRDDMYRRGVA